MIDSEKSLRKAVVIPTGREILTGRIQDTNSQWLCSHLFDLGVKVIRVTVADDDHDDIAREFHRAADDGADIIITTGGLGPTADDMTITCVADAVSKPLVRSAQALQMIEGRYRHLVEIGRLDNADMNEYRAKMADLPEGSTMMANTVGSAPGADFMWNGTRVFCLPGPPREMIPMAQAYVFEAIGKMVQGVLVRKTIEIGLFDESRVAVVIEQLQPSWPGVHFKTDPALIDGRRVMQVHLEAGGADAGDVGRMLDDAAVALTDAADLFAGR